MIKITDNQGLAHRLYVIFYINNLYIYLILYLWNCWL